MSAKRILCLIAPGFEEIELVTPVDLLLRMNAQVTLASVTGDKTVRGAHGLRLEATRMLEEVEELHWDLLLIPGGPGVFELRNDPRIAAQIRQQIHDGQPVAAICAAPLLLADAGVLEGKRFTAHAGVRDLLPGVEEGRVIEDGLIITSRGAGTALDFGLALVRRLYGEEAAVKLREAIMA